MGGTADGGQAVGQEAPVDLVSVREAARVAGVTPSTVHAWIKSGRLPAQAAQHGRLVSLSAVHALRAAPDPQAPDEARPVSEVAPAVGVPPWRIAGWLRRGLLPSWRGRYGRLVLVEDVRALAQQRTTRLSAAGAATPMPADALFIRDVVRLSGVTKGRIYAWMRRGLLPFWPGTGTGQRVRLADVLALAERPGRALPPLPERES